MEVSRIGVGLMDKLSAAVNPVNPTGEVKNVTSFGSVLKNATSGDSNPKMKMDSGNAGEKSNFDEAMAEAKNNLEDTGSRLSESSNKSEKAAVVEKTDNEMGNAVDEAIGKIKEVIMEESGVSEEELEEAMISLGISPIELLDVGNITDLVAELTGSEVSDILTDENLSAMVMNINSEVVQITSELLQELDLTADVLEGLIQEGDLTVENEIIPEKSEENAVDIRLKDSKSPDRPFEDYLKKEDIQVTVSRPEEKGERVYERNERNIENDRQEKFQVTISKDEETAGTTTETVSISIEPGRADRQPTTGGEQSENSTLKEYNTEVQKPVEETVKEKGTEEGSPDQDFHGNSQEKNRGSINLLFQNNLTNAIKEAVGGNDQAEVTKASNQLEMQQRVENILNQVKEEINISVNRESSSMELQLNPASLGKVALHIETKAGAVTAQFVAENAQVKQALESQVTELKETLINKGIRIEEVEVTVASHAFEQNFMNGGENRSGSFNDSPDGRERSARLRRINLMASGNEAEENVSEEDELARRIMIDNGNSVDYTA